MTFVKSVTINCSLDDNQINLSYFSDNLLDCGDHVRAKLGMDLNDGKNLKMYQKKGILHIGMISKFCPKCGSSKVSFNGFNERDIIFPDTGKETVKIQKYVCNKGCNNGKNLYFKTNIDYIVDSNSNYSKKYKEEAVELYAEGFVSTRSSAKLMNSRADTHVSHQSIQNWILETPEHPKIEPSTLSGYYVFDAQWVKTDKTWSYRLLLADAKTEKVIRSKTYAEENIDSINKFISETLINQKKICITTDLKKEYKPIVEKLGFKQQWCMYHTRKAFIKAFRKYKKENKLSSYEKSLVDYYIEKFMLMFNQPSYDNAMESLNWFLKEFEYLPDFIQIQLQEKIIPYFKTFTLHLTDNKVPKTSNLCENIFGKTNPKYIKRRTKISEGVDARCRLREQKWNDKK
jgi:hypothetical protein